MELEDPSEELVAGFHDWLLSDTNAEEKERAFQRLFEEMLSVESECDEPQKVV